jgi:hypothetical protein
VDERNAHARKDASLLNGSSLAHLTGAATSSRLVTEVCLPASRMAEVLEHIHQLRDTGSLQVNFHKGRALDLKWTGTRDAKGAGDA